MLRIINSHLSLDYLSKYSNGDTFIETGTYLGDTVWLALEHGFQTIHSIELNDQLFLNAMKLFDHNKNIMIWNGDSIDCLEKIFKMVDGPATFWLDAHASGPLKGGKSGGSPVLDELRLIKNHSCKEHTIFIDDRRLFGSDEWSGVKEEDAISLLREINPAYKIHFLDGHIEKDVVCASIKA